jgi:hypothetical protein
MLALRVSNIVSFAMLLAAGYGYCHYGRINLWKTGLALLSAGAVLGVTAILLEGLAQQNWVP